MLKVRMRTGGAGPNGTWQPGQELEFPDEIARDMVTAGYGQLVKAPAVQEDPEEVALMALSNDELLELCVANEITGLSPRPTKAQLVATLRAHGVSVLEVEPAGELETAELGGGEVAANTEPPQPRERVMVNPEDVGDVSDVLDAAAE